MSDEKAPEPIPAEGEKTMYKQAMKTQMRSIERSQEELLRAQEELRRLVVLGVDKFWVEQIRNKLQPIPWPSEPQQSIPGPSGSMFNVLPTLGLKM